MELKINERDLFKSNSHCETFLGYGDIEKLTENEGNEAIKRINSYRGINFVVSAPGKVILFGEHGVNYGKPAIAASIDKRTYLRFTENKINSIFAISMRDINFACHLSFDKVIKFINKDIPGHNLQPLNRPIDNPNSINHKMFLELFKDNFESIIHPVAGNREQITSFCVFLYLLHGIFYKENSEIIEPKSKLLSPMVVDISSELRMCAGIGSSASFSVCIAAALLHYKNLKIYGFNSAKEITFSDMGLELISKWAFNAERIVHGILSGIDSAVATYGSFIEVSNVTMKRKFIDVPDPPQLHLILINSGVKRNTVDVVNKIAIRYSHSPGLIQPILNSIQEVTNKAVNLIKVLGLSQFNATGSSEFQLLEELVNINQGLLYSLGASHNNLQEICSVCSEYGLSAKLTGAGGGGCAFAFLPSDFQKDMFMKLVDKLTHKNYEVFEVKLGEEGVRLEDLTKLKESR